MVNVRVGAGRGLGALPPRKYAKLTKKQENALWKAALKRGAERSFIEERATQMPISFRIGKVKPEPTYDWLLDLGGNNE